MSTTVEASKNFSILDDVELDETYEKNSEKIKLSLEYLTDLKEVHKIVADRRALKIALFFYKLTHSENLKHCLTEIDYLNNPNLAEYFSHIFEYCCDYMTQFLAENEFLNGHSGNSKSSKSKNSQQYKALKIKYHFVSYLIDVVSFYTEISNQFRVKFHDAKGTEVLMGYLSNEKFIKDCLRFNYGPNDSSPVGLTLLESFICTIYHLSKIADSVKNDWVEMDATVKLMKFSTFINRF